MTTSSIDEAVKILNAGGVGVLPTDTLYGLVARAEDPSAVKRLYMLKNRENRPGTLIAANIEQLVKLGLSKKELDKVAHFWPNPISIEMPFDKPAYLHQSTNKIAVRVVADPRIRDILLETGPLATSSANITGDPSSTTIKMAQDYFGDLIDFYVDGGDLSSREPSTIISYRNGEIAIIREGAVSKVELLKISQLK